MKFKLIILISTLVLLSGCSVSSDKIVVNSSYSGDYTFYSPSTFSIGTKEYDLTRIENEIINNEYVLSIEFDGWTFVDNILGYFQFLDDFSYTFLDSNYNPVDVRVETDTNNKLIVKSDTEIKYVVLESNGESISWEL